MKILITGNKGYIGSVLGSYLQTMGYQVHGLDSGFFEDCSLDKKFNDISTAAKDVRDIEDNDIRGFDCVIHLAALSNDPVGEIDEALTYKINYSATVNLALICKRVGVGKFIFASTQSIYGISKSDSELEEDNSIKNPQTAYAKSKWLAEQETLGMADNDFCPVALRPSTVFGWSPRLRTDIVFNNLLVSGYVNNALDIHSDGTPWRPIIHVRDVARIVEICISAESAKISGQAFNVGMLNGNYTVAQIAIEANKCLGNKLDIRFNTESLKDPRSYKVSFKKAEKILGFQAQYDLNFGGNEILEKISELEISKLELLGRRTNRISQISFLKDSGRINSKLEFLH